MLVFNLNQQKVINDMKKLLTTLALTATLSFGAIADDAVDFCVSYSEAAELIMAQRQNNVSMSELYKIVSDNDIMKTLLKEAYKAPLYSTAKYKAEAVDTFKNDTFMVCIQTMGEKREMD